MRERLLPAASLALAAIFAASAQTPNRSDLPHLLEAGERAMQKGDAVEAEHLFQQATQLAPRLAPAYLGLGLVQLREGKLPEAIASLENCTQLNPRLKEAHLLLGMAEYQEGQLTEAETSLKAELSLNADDGEALTWLGMVQIAAGHPERAVEPLDHAARIDPRNPDLLYYRGRAHSMVAQANYRQLYDQAPDSPLVHRALAESLADSGQPEKAITEFLAAIRQQPGNADLYEELGEQYQKISRFDAAQQAYRQELALHPRSGIALYNLGKIDVEANRADSGVPLLQQAIAAHVAGAPAAYYLGYGLAQLGRNEEASRWLKEALERSPSPFIQQSALFQLSRVYNKLGRTEDARSTAEQLREMKQKSSPGKTATGALSPSGVEVFAPAPASPSPPLPEGQP